jgi:predicted transposase YbfD/YdcC
MDAPQYTNLRAALAAVPDPRCRRGQRYPWPVLLTLLAAGLVSGQKSVRAIAQWVAEHAAELELLAGLPPGRVPSAATLRRALRAVDLAALEARIAAFVAELPTASPPVGAPPTPPLPWVGLALDGKAVRGANRHGTRVHLVGLVRHDDGRVLSQRAVADKSNEITAAPRLLERRDLRGTVTTTDALLTQRAVATKIVTQGGHYLMAVKENQPALLAAITTLFAHPPLPVAAADADIAATCDKGHGRLELRTLERSAALNAYLDWPSVGQVLRRTCQRVALTTGAITEEVTYGVTSLPPHETSAAQVEALWRGHWTIENRVHYVRDVTWGEDAGQVRQGHAPQALAALRNGRPKPAARLRLDPDRRRHSPLRRLRPPRPHPHLVTPGATLTPPCPSTSSWPGSCALDRLNR